MDHNSNSSSAPYEEGEVYKAKIIDQIVTKNFDGESNSF
jgi:hypothetical protein